MVALIIDVETTIRNQKDFYNNGSGVVVGKMAASPYHPDNFITHLGMRVEGSKSTYTFSYKPATKSSLPNETTMLVGHNIKFDLLHLFNKRGSYFINIQEFFQRGGKIWDTMLAEYLITTQRVKFAKLDTLALEYGGEVKDDRVKQFWDDGIDTVDIPEEILIPYLDGDCANTELIFLQQREIATELGMLPLIESQMDALLATTYMEWHGMKFNLEVANEEIAKLKVLLEMANDDARSRLRTFITDIKLMDKIDWNFKSAKQISAILFGTELEYSEMREWLDEDGVVQRYKTGKRKGEVKMKKAIITVDKIAAVLTPISDKTKLGYYKCDVNTLKELTANPCVSMNVKAFIKELVNIREYEKQIGTYFEGYSNLVWPDGMIHGTLNHCQTETGRLSSSKPNLQNVSGKES